MLLLCGYIVIQQVIFQLKGGESDEIIWNVAFKSSGEHIGFTKYNYS